MAQMQAVEIADRDGAGLRQGMESVSEAHPFVQAGKSRNFSRFARYSAARRLN
jgi:hypothetical protein